VSPEVDSRRGFLGPDSAAGAGLSQSPRSASLITALYGVQGWTPFQSRIHVTTD
jgi:hypothetical protein